VRKVTLIIAAIATLISAAWVPNGSPASPNVPGYDVFPIIYQSNNYSGQDYDYVWSTYDHSGTPGVYTAGTDSNWGSKLFQYGWIQTPAQITTCTATPCQGDFAGASNLVPTVAYFITMMRDNYIPNKLQSNRTGVLVVPCAEGGTGYTDVSSYTYNTNAAASIGAFTITMNHNWGVIVGATITDPSHSTAIPAGTTVTSLTPTSVTFSQAIVSPGVSSGDYIQFNNGIGDWQVGGQLYEGCLARTNEVMALDPNNRLIAVLGNGGEADSGRCVSQVQYTTYTQTMTADFRSRATRGSSVSFLFGGMVPYWVSTNSCAVPVEAAIAAMPSNVTRSAFVDPTGLADQINQYTGPYTVTSITIPSNPCALTVASTDTRTLTNGATNRFTSFTGTTELNGNLATTVVSQTAGVSADITVPVNCTNAWTGSSGKAYLLRGFAGNGIHFSAESERELGNRYYNALVPLL
jgi:hypothetical protein